MERELFTLLRLGLGNSKAEEENLSDFFMLPAVKWARLGELAREQGVLGVMLDGIDYLDDTGYGATRQLSKKQKLEWIGNVLKGYEARNQHQMQVIDNLQKFWSEAGLRMMVFKGQAMGTYYPVPKHRAPGDIDCYLFDGYARGNEMAKTIADRVNEGWYKHSVISYKGETIENHQYFVHTREGRRSKQLNQLLTDELRVEGLELKELNGTAALLPPSMFNAVFLTYHALTHFLEEGLRLKQIVDWAMFLKQDGDKVDWQEFNRICDKFHFRRFVNVMNDIAVRCLGVKTSGLKIQFSESMYTEKVLLSTFNERDYVFCSGKSSWANRWHIVRNLFRYRWKYQEIYQHSVLRQLWWYGIGYVFKTE